MNARPRAATRAAALAVLMGLASLGVLGIGPAGAHPAQQSSQDDGWTKTQTLTRTFGDGTAPDNRSVTVTADKHLELQDHERVGISWKGAHATGGRVSNPYGESGLDQEYPVVILECRGVDPLNGDPAQGQSVASPKTCWTNTNTERSAQSAPGTGIWQLDANAPDDDKGHVSGIDAGDIPKSCNVTSSFDYHVTPFVAANGKVYPGCDAQSMPPEATAGSSNIPNEIFAFTDSTGRGNVEFEVRTDIENESLGCSSTVPCTIEVVPVDGIDCASTDDSKVCNSTGHLPSGKFNTAGIAAAPAVSGDFWWSASNWNRRFAIPVTFAPPPTVCSTSSVAGKPTPFYGSELLSQAALQWTPAYCLNKSRFNWQDNILPDDAAFSLMNTGGAPAALVSGARDGTHVGYAPTAITSWAIAFNVDKPNNAGQQMTLKLNARLLAKLLTESYPGGLTVKLSHPGMAANPTTLNLDPEFQALNPGLDTRQVTEAEASLLSLSTGSDVISQLTSYIASDKAAMAFIHGKADPWGMRVNPFYKDIKLPVSTWPLLDTWKNKFTGQGCLNTAPTAYMPLIASPMSQFRLIAVAMLFNWPNVTTQCNGSGTTQDPYQLARVPVQNLGSRFMLGVVTLGDAERYGLTTASLEAAPGHFVAATNAGMRDAIKLAEPTKGKDQPYQLSESAIRKSKTAYPGTMIVYTAAKTSGLEANAQPEIPAAQRTRDARRVAQFIRISTTEGQRPGRGNGELPEGYLPITASGATKPLYDQAQRVARAVAAQKAPRAPKAPSTPAPTHTAPSSGGGATAPAPTGGATPQAAPSAAPAVATGPIVRTAKLTSGAAGSVLPLLLAIGLISGAATVIARFWLQVKGVR